MLSIILSSLFALSQAVPHGKSHGPALNAGLTRDLATIKAFASHITGPTNVTTNWTQAGEDLSKWTGFFLETNPDTNQLALASIDLNSNYHLEGDYQLEGFLDKLVDIALFHANTNNFKGTIPNLSQLKYLYELDLSNNQLSGSFPKNAFSAHGLVFFDIRFNNFEGELPAELFTTWPDVEVIFVNNNKFHGELPNSIGAFPGQYLSIANNKFSGALPTTLVNAASLQEFMALGNEFTGTIPQGLGNLANLTVFDVSDNKLTGPVPEDLCASKSIQTIVVSGNNMDKNLGPHCAEAQKKGILTV